MVALPGDSHRRRDGEEDPRPGQEHKVWGGGEEMERGERGRDWRGIGEGKFRKRKSREMQG